MVVLYRISLRNCRWTNVTDWHSWNVSTQNAFSLPFAAILVNCAPSGEINNYCTPHIIKENFENFLIHQCNYILLSQVYCVWQVVKAPTIISNNLVCLCSIVILTSNGKFLDCATIALSEQYDSRISLSHLNPKRPCLGSHCNRFAFEYFSVSSQYNSSNTSYSFVRHRRNINVAADVFVK